MQTLTLDQLPTPILLVWGLPEGSINPVASMGYLSAKVPNLANYCHVDTMADPVKLQKWLDTHKEEDDYKQEIWKIPDGEWKLFGKLSELTEEQAIGLVENIEIPFAPDEICYPDYRIYNVTGFGALDTALASFKSSIKSAGYYFQNPMGKRYDPSVCVKYPEYRQEQSFNEYDGELRKAYSKAWSDWQDAQSKTLPANTLIFKRV